MEIRFLQAGCGDAIHIRFEGADNHYHNILIDGGAERHDVYDNGIRQALISILDKKEIIDLWIITHIDDDHIGGILRFIQDHSLYKTFDFSKTIFWYNAWHSDYLVRISRSSQKSVNQGIRLREFLKSVSHVDSLVTDQTHLDFYGAQLTVLSPSAERLGSLLEKWEKSEALLKKKRETKKAATSHDYGTLISNFDITFFKEDGSEANGSSIAFIFSRQGKSALFSADSHPSVLCHTLRRLGFSESRRLRLDLCQVPHHGSKFNTNAELIQLIDCNESAVTALETVIASDTYDLVPKYADVFSVSNENNIESIFEIQYKSDASGEGGGDGGLSSTGDGDNWPSANLLKVFFDNADDRFDASVDTTFNYPKFAKLKDKRGADGSFGANFIVLRYADVLLMTAEALNELGYNRGNAFDYLNQVRQRAGAQTHDVNSLPDQQSFRQAIELERRLELAFENHRWFDLLRTNRALDEMSTTEGGSAFAISIESYQLLFPIPLVQVDASGGRIVQNAGY